MKFFVTLLGKINYIKGLVNVNVNTDHDFHNKQYTCYCVNG